MTIDGKNFGWKIIFFIPVFALIIADALPVSEPVPAVVGIAIIGEIFFHLPFSNNHQYPQNPK